MSKPESGLFSGTSGVLDFYGDAEQLIAERVTGLDLSEHPIRRKQLSAKRKKEIRARIRRRTATREEYELYMWNKRLARRRKEGIDKFWDSERKLLTSGKRGTRNWTDEQRDAILRGKKPEFDGAVMQSHHAYSVSRYPHLANSGGVIYPATTYEHLQGWHGGAYKKSLPGRRIRRIQEF